MDTGRAIRLRFKYTLSDAMRGRRLHFSKSRSNKILRLFALLLIIFNGYTLYSYVKYQFIDIWIMLSVFSLLISVGVLFNLFSLYGLWKSFKKENEPEYEFAFDEIGASYQSPGIDVKVTWSNFEKAFENEHVFLLFLKEHPNEYWLIPKQYFSRIEDVTTFRELVKSHLS